MNADTLRWILIAVVVVDTVFNAWLDRLNLNHSRGPLPADLAGQFDEEQRQKSLEYQAANYRFGVIHTAFDTTLILAMLWFGGFGKLDNYFVERWWMGRAMDSVSIALAFFGVLMIAMRLTNIPFSAYRIFVIEEKFGFNKTTVKTFVLDQIKGTLLSAVFGSVIITGLMLIYWNDGTSFVFRFWSVLATFIFLMFAGGNALLLPIFNKLSRLPDGPLRDALVAYCNSQNYKVSRLFVMDGSKRSTKANAFFTGFGPTRTIALFDTLVENYTTEEVTAVLAHEVGHYRRRHVFVMYFFTVAQLYLFIWLIQWLAGAPEVAEALGAESMGLELAIVAFALFFTPMSEVLTWISSTISRANEFAADRFSVATYAGPHLRTALKKMSTDSLSNLNPHPLYVAVHYSHPPVRQRLAVLPKE